MFECYQAPFPVGPGAGDFRMCRADMVNNCVVVRSPEDMDQLYNKVLSVLTTLPFSHQGSSVSFLLHQAQNTFSIKPAKVCCS